MQIYPHSSPGIPEEGELRRLGRGDQSLDFAGPQVAAADPHIIDVAVQTAGPRRVRRIAAEFNRADGRELLGQVIGTGHVLAVDAHTLGIVATINAPARSMCW